MGSCSISTFEVVTYRTLLLAIFIAIPWLFIFAIMKVGGLSLARDFPDHSVSSLVGTLYPLVRIGTLPAWRNSSDLCDFPDLQYHH